MPVAGTQLRCGRAILFRLQSLLTFRQLSEVWSFHLCSLQHAWALFLPSFAENPQPTRIPVNIKVWRTKCHCELSCLWMYSFGSHSHPCLPACTGLAKSMLQFNTRLKQKSLSKRSSSKEKHSRSKEKWVIWSVSVDNIFSDPPHIPELAHTHCGSSSEPPRHSVCTSSSLH